MHLTRCGGDGEARVLRRSRMVPDGPGEGRSDTEAAEARRVEVGAPVQHAAVAVATRTLRGAGRCATCSGSRGGERDLPAILLADSPAISPAILLAVLLDGDWQLARTWRIAPGLARSKLSRDFDATWSLAVSAGELSRHLPAGDMCW